MDPMRLAAVVCREFSANVSEGSNTVVEVKGGQSRDVVTKLDRRLHEKVERFFHESDPTTVVMSEEGASRELSTYWKATSLGVVDPLDGSNNFALSIPAYGFMAAYLQRLRIVSSVVVLPEEGLYLVWNGVSLVASRPLSFNSTAPSAPIYYAYPPTFDESRAVIRNRLSFLIDQNSAGMYRFGSACIGLFQLLIGAQRAFIGQQIRVWDVLAFLPILAHRGFFVRYRIDGLSVTLVAGLDPKLMSLLEEAVTDNVGGPLYPFDHTASIVVEGI